MGGNLEPASVLVRLWGSLMSHSKNHTESSVTEGGKAEAPTEGKGHAKPAVSHADAEGASEAGTSSATAGKAEKQVAAGAGAAKEQHGRGHRKAD